VGKGFSSNQVVLKYQKWKSYIREIKPYFPKSEKLGDNKANHQG